MIKTESDTCEKKLLSFVALLHITWGLHCRTDVSE